MVMDGVQWQNVHAVTGWFGIRIIRMLDFYCASRYVAGTWFQKLHDDEPCWLLASQKACIKHTGCLFCLDVLGIICVSLPGLCRVLAGS
jgi:hypothetical protein